MCVGACREYARTAPPGPSSTHGRPGSRARRYARRTRTPHTLARPVPTERPARRATHRPGGAATVVTLVVLYAGGASSPSTSARPRYLRSASSVPWLASAGSSRGLQSFPGSRALGPSHRFCRSRTTCTVSCTPSRASAAPSSSPPCRLSSGPDTGCGSRPSSPERCLPGPATSDGDNLSRRWGSRRRWRGVCSS